MGWGYSEPRADIPPGHAWQDDSGRFPLDAKLRRRGYKIAARPRRGEACWTDGQRVMTQSEALRQVAGAEAAEKADRLRLKGGLD